MGRHLLLTRCKKRSSDADRPILLNNALTDLKNECLAFSREHLNLQDLTSTTPKYLIQSTHWIDNISTKQRGSEFQWYAPVLGRVHTGDKIHFDFVASIRDKIDRVDSVASRDFVADTDDFVASTGVVAVDFVATAMVVWFL